MPHINEIFARDGLTCSFEFFPPKSPQGAESLFQAVRELESLKPSFVSMTYGAGGSTRDLTHDLVLRLKRETTLDPIPHLTCIGHTEAEIEAIVTRYAKAGISNILALSGDPPRGQQDYDRSRDQFRYASDLVRFIRRFNERGLHEHPTGFGIGIAGFPEGHPATPNRMREMDYLKQKVDEGGSFIITQMFFDNRDLYDFRERCELAGIRVPIIAGIMPITSVEGMRRMSELALGVRFPARLQRAVHRAGDDQAAIARVGIHWATEQCLDLIDQGVGGLHFYTLNKSRATLEIYRHLGVRDSVGLRQ